MNHEPEILLQAHDLHAWYDSSHILHGINLELYQGQTMGLLGRNGMGKSTLIRTLLGLVPQRQGEITIRGIHSIDLPTHQVARLGVAYVPEGRGVFPNLSVRENLVMAAHPGRDGRKDWDLERGLDTFPRLKERFTNLGGQLSGGEQERVAIARAVVNEPPILYADEPTGNLDPATSIGIMKLLDRINREGTTVLMATHDSGIVDQMRKRVIELDRGHVVRDQVRGVYGYTG